MSFKEAFMNYVETQIERLKGQVIEQNMEADFADFWRGEVKKLRNVPLKVQRKPMELPYKSFKAYEVTFNTHDETQVVGYLCVPGDYREGQRLPCVAVYHGGGGSYGVYPDIVATGVCTFSIDLRNQCGKTYDRADYDEISDYRGGIMSHGMTDKNNYYMKNLYLDAVRAIDVIESFPEVDTERIVSFGLSQGGALTIVSAALSGKVKKAYPCVPSYACLERRVELGSGVFEAVKYFLHRNPERTDEVLRMLSYFDINNMVSQLQVPTDFFLGLTDTVCIPPFVYSLYANTNAPKKITLAPFTGHEISREYKTQLLWEFRGL